MYYNTNTQKIISNPRLEVPKNISLPRNADDSYYKEYGIYPVNKITIEGNILQDIEEQEIALIDGEYVINTILIDKDLDLAKEITKEKLKELFIKKSKKIITSTEFGAVNGDRESKDNFKTKAEMMLEDEITTIRLANNSFVEDITKDNMESIWKEIAADGEELYQWKWEKEIEIETLDSIQDLLNFLHNLGIDTLR
jgi:hypothetical protein